MNQVVEVGVQCPYCWEAITLLVDASIESQAYVEDCEVCCRPIDFEIEVDEENQIRVNALSQQE